MSKVDAKVLGKLKAIGAAAVGEFYGLPMQLKALVDLGYVETNPDMKKGKDVCARLTELGTAIVANDGEIPEADEGGDEDDSQIGDFVIADVALPPVSRNSESTSKYPFDKLVNGKSFFIASDAKNASKTYGSMVASQNKKYGKFESTFKRFTTRSTLGDAWGKPGVKGVAVFRLTADEEAKAKAKAFPTT